MKLEEQTINKNYVFHGKIISVRCDDALLPDGNPCKREVVEHHGGACVLAVIDDKVLLVRQFRYAYGEVLWEIPAGKLEQGEDPARAAVRELEEEAGFVAGNIEHLFTIYPTPGYCNEKIYIYEAKDIKMGKVHLDTDEFLSAELVPLEVAYTMVQNGTIRDAKTIIALLQYKTR